MAKAVSKLELPINIAIFIPLAENLPSGKLFLRLMLFLIKY